jgi:hypothetical protein
VTMGGDVGGTAWTEGQVRVASDDARHEVGRVGWCLEHLLVVQLPFAFHPRTATESALLSEANCHVCGLIRAWRAQELYVGCVDPYALLVLGKH